MTFVGLKRKEGADEKRCREFIACLLERLKKGPPERREVGDIPAYDGDINFVDAPVGSASAGSDAERRVNEVASACNPDWGDLYEIGSPPAE